MDAWYAGRRAVVTGGLGFIGGHLSRRLVEAGAGVSIVTPSRDRYPDTAVSLERAGARIVCGDVRDASPWRASLDGASVVFHLAARSGATASMADPSVDLDVNCRGTLTLLDTMRAACPDAKVIVPGSRLQYGRPDALPVAEDSAMTPLCVHAVHKSTVEQYLHVYRHNYGLRFTALRLTNPYGPGQPRDRVAYGIVNRFVHLALAAEPLPVFGDGAQLRDYVYIDDVVNALMMAGSDERSDGGTYNVGSGVGTRLVDVATAICEVAGSGRVTFVPWPHAAAQIETGDFVADVSRLAADVGWRPCVSLDQGIRRTIAAYRRG